MELIPCSGAAEPGSETAFQYDGKSDQIGEENLKLDGLGGDESQFIFERFDGGSNGDAYYDFDGQNLTVDSHDSEDDDNSQLVMDTTESGISNNNQEGSSQPELKALEQDEAQAVWVKWRGKWQSGIQCARADWPLSTLRAKPTHDRKQYLVIFFPRTRNYSWADVLLVRPINEFPEPIAYKTHKHGVKMVQDSTLARRFIMQKLAVSMINILDQLHREALVETARDVVVLKDFAMEASRCVDYSDLGRMLLKLQNMILPCCLTSQHSFESWKQQCRDANSAECVEMLKEELGESISWDEVNSLLVEPGPPEWRTWKHESMKWFSISNPISPPDQPISDNSPLSTGPRKRPKLEIRRAEPHNSHPSTITLEPDSNFFTISNFDTPKKENSIDDSAPHDKKWDDIVLEAGSSAIVVSEKNNLDHNHRQCVAFIEAKGRQCVRYANDGDVYCCVHLASRFVSNSSTNEFSPPVDSPMCGGTTVLGTKCKHRALIGSSFCKKHGPHEYKNTPPPAPPVNILKRKNQETGTNVTSPSIFAIVKPDLTEARHVSDEVVECIGSWDQEGTATGPTAPCLDPPTRHSLYCEKHIPSWLKRARNGKSRIVSKEVYLDLLKECHMRERKLQLHQACELFYRLFKSILSLRNPVPKEVQFQWAILEASKDRKVGEFLTKLVSTEKERLKKMYELGGGGVDENVPMLAIEGSVPNQIPIPIPIPIDGESTEKVVTKCKICSENFPNDVALGAHWTEAHKKEAQWLFRGYVCAICLDSFTNKKVLEAHVQERHHVMFVEQCMLLQCAPCGSHFGNPDELWRHVLSNHNSDLKLLPNAPLKNDEPNESLKNTNSDDPSGRRFICRFCGLKFDLLPDLGRHHQAAHMGQIPAGSRLKKKGMQFYAQKMKSGRRFKKGLHSTTFNKIRNLKNVQNLKKNITIASPVEIPVQNIKPEAPYSSLDMLGDSQSAAVAKTLFCEVKKTKLQPNVSEILSIASSACCRANVQASLEGKFGILPERMYLKAAKLCSERSILVEWHREGFVCPKGCARNVEFPILPPLVSFSGNIFKSGSSVQSNIVTSEWTMDESHCVIDSRHFSLDFSENNVILCDDISFGQEPVPIVCAVDENLLNDVGPDGQIIEFSFPWESFTYVTKSLIDQSIDLEVESSQLGCSCPHSTCLPQMCDHVYLFDNDYEDAKDIYGKPMNGRFPYDERGRIILEEGYVVYECNERCGCNGVCQNRVLQHGVGVKLEIFKTEGKGWAVRARQSILRGTFVCEYIGEVIDEEEANERRDRYGKEVCEYFFEIDSHINDMSRLIEGQVSYVIDATNYGNISRYINHSCSPNLVNHQVVVESMDSQLAHVGFYASRDISLGEELTYNFRYKLLPGDGCPCLCGASNCRGRLY